MRLKLNILILVVTTVALLGCKSSKPLIQVPIKTVERRVTTLVPFLIPGDSVTMQAYFECDSLNNVLLKEMSEQKGRRMNTDIDFKDGKLNYKAELKPDTVYLPQDSVIVDREVPVIVKVPVETNRLTSWQEFRIKLGDALIGLLVLFGVYSFIKQKFKIL